MLAGFFYRHQRCLVEDAVCDILAERGEMSGRELRAALAERGHKYTAPRFYDRMANLEGQGIIRGWYVTKTIGGDVCKERRYDRA